VESRWRKSWLAGGWCRGAKCLRTCAGSSGWQL